MGESLQQKWGTHMFMKMRKEKKKKKGYWQSFDYKVTGNLSLKFKLKSTVVELELVCLAF